MQPPFSRSQIEQFIRTGFLCLDEAFPRPLAAAAREILWKDLPLDRNDRSTWTDPVHRLGMYGEAPFVASANTPLLRAAFDQLVGPGRWLPVREMGSFPVRFPHDTTAGDTGKHVDASFPGVDPADYFQWRINHRSRGRALLLLFLYSDVGTADAPTVIYPESHRAVADLLRPAGKEGRSFTDLAGRLDELSLAAPTLATGPAGTVYLCHPFLVHAARAHRGREPKFMAQPPLRWKGGLRAAGEAVRYPVDEAVG